MNQFIFIGDVTEINLQDNYFKVSVKRLYKNLDGDYDKDNLKVFAYKQINEQLKEHLCEGQIVGVRGRVETRDNEIVLIADKVSLLTREERN